MIRLLGIIFLLAFPVPSFAEWTQIGNDDAREDYVDYEYLANAKTKNNSLKVWTLINHKKVIANASGVPVLSTKVLYEIDCINRETRISYIVAYSDFMGNGKQLTAASPKLDKAPIIPGSLQDVFRKTGCPAS